MLAVHCDVDVMSVCCALDERSSFIDMEREWRRIATTQTVMHNHLSLVQSSFVKFVRIMTDVSVFAPASPHRKHTSSSAASGDEDDDDAVIQGEEEDHDDDQEEGASDGGNSSARSRSPGSPAAANWKKLRPQSGGSGGNSGSRNSPPQHYLNAAPKPQQLPVVVIQRCFDELDISHNGKISWPRFRSFMTLVAEMRRSPPQFCSRRHPIVCDVTSVPDIEMCTSLPQWRLTAISSGKADGKIHLVDATGAVRSTMQNPKQKGLITGVFLVSLPRMVKLSQVTLDPVGPPPSSQHDSKKRGDSSSSNNKRGAGSSSSRPHSAEGKRSSSGAGGGGGEDADLLTSAFPQLVTSATDGSVVVWDLDRNGNLDSSKHINLERPVVFLAFDKGSSLFFALLDNGSLVSVEWGVPPDSAAKEHALSVHTCRLVMDPVGPHTTHPSCLAVVPALSQVATAGDDAIIALWKAEDLTCICRVVTGSGVRAAIKSLLVLPKMSRVLAVHHSRNITCWDVGGMLLEGKDTIGVLRGAHEHAVVSVFADVFGDFIVSVDTRCTICVWSAKSMLLLERTETPLSKWDKRSLASIEVKCAAYDQTTRDLTIFAGSRLRRFSGIASGLCAPRADQPFERVCPPALLGRQLLGRSPSLTRLVEIDDAASLLIYVTAWDLGFFSLVDGSLIAHISTRDIFGTSIGSEGVTHAFLSHLPPSRRLASDVAASFLSLADAAGRVVGAVPASIVQAETPGDRLDCFRRVVLDTASPVKVKLEPTSPVPGSDSLVIPSLFGVFIFAFRGCMVALSHSCIMTCVLKRESHEALDRNEEAESDSKYLILEPVSFQSFQNLSIAPVTLRRGGRGSSAGTSNANSAATSKRGSVSILGTAAAAAAQSPLVLRGASSPTSTQAGGDDGVFEGPSATTYTRKLRHVRVNSNSRFFSMCFHGVRQVTLFQYNRTSTTPNSTDLVIREAFFDWGQPVKSVDLSTISDTTHPHLFPTSSIESEDESNHSSNNHNNSSTSLLFVTYGSDRLVAFSLQRSAVVPILQLHSLDTVFSSSVEIQGAAHIRQWRLSVMNAGGLGKHLVLVPEFDEGDSSLLESSVRRRAAALSNNVDSIGHFGSFKASPAGSKGMIEPAATLGNLSHSDAASDCFILPVSWFVDTFVSARKADLHTGETVRDPVVPGTCLVFKPSLAAHFEGHGLPENLHHPKRESILFPATVGEDGAPVLLKVFHHHSTHVAALRTVRDMSMRAKRCVVRVIYHWDLSADALPHQIPLPADLDPSMLNVIAAQQQKEQQRDTELQSPGLQGQMLLSNSFFADPPQQEDDDGTLRKKFLQQEKERELRIKQQHIRDQAAIDPPPLRGVVVELGRVRLRDLLHAPMVERVHSMLSVVDCLSELHASGFTSIDISPNSVVQAADGRWKLSSLHAVRKLPPYGQPEYRAETDAPALYPWYCDMEFANNWVKRSGSPPHLPSALWAAGCISFELAMQQLPFQVETPPHGYFDLPDVMNGLSHVIAATVREVIANAKRTVAEKFNKKDQGYATIMLDFASICLLPSVQTQANFTYVTRQLRLMIEAASAEHYRDEVIRRCDREAAMLGDGGGDVGAGGGGGSLAVVKGRGAGAAGAGGGAPGGSSPSKATVHDDFILLASSAAGSTDAREIASNVVSVNANADVPWFTPDLAQHFLIAPNRVTAVATGTSVVVAVTLDRFANGGLGDQGMTFDPFLRSRRESNAAGSSDYGASPRRQSGGFGGLFEIAGAALLAAKIEDSNGAFVAPPSAAFLIGDEDRKREEQLEGLRRRLDPPKDNHSSANFSVVHRTGGGGEHDQQDGTTRASFEGNRSIVEPRTGTMVLLCIDIKDGSSGQDKSSRINRGHILNCGLAPPPLFGRYAAGVIRWTLPSRCVGASNRLTMAAPFAAAQWMAREFGSVANAPTPFAESFATALLPPDISALGTSIAPGDECNYSKLSHSCLERAVVGNWEAFTPGEIQALFKVSANAPSERATMEQWERNLARRAPYFACAIEAVAQQDKESKAAVRLGRAVEITQNSNRSLLDALQLAHKGDSRRVDRSRKKSRREPIPGTSSAKRVNSPASRAGAGGGGGGGTPTPSRSSAGGKTPLGKLKSTGGL